jgi:hypothetical protein
VDLLGKVGRILEREGIAWAVIGALAVSFHGVVRVSLDADALISFKGSHTDIDAFVAKLKAAGWKAEYRSGEPGDPLGFVVRILDKRGNQVDLIGGIRKLDSGFFRRAEKAKLGNLELRIAGAEDVIALKMFAGGPKDLEDAAGILDVSGKKIDEALLLKLCKGFGPAEEKQLKRLLKKNNQSSMP